MPKLSLAEGDAGLKSVAELRRARAAELARRDRETRDLVAKARAAQAEGKESLAAGYYRTASRQATGPLKQQVDRELGHLRAQAAARREGHNATQPPLGH